MNLPHDEEAEKTLLGNMLCNKDECYLYHHYLTEESFYNPQHQTIWAAMQRVLNRQAVPDLSSTLSELNTMGIKEGDIIILVFKLTQPIGLARNTKFHVDTLIEKQLLRSIINTTMQVYNDAHNADANALQLMDYMAKNMATMQHAISGRSSMRSIKQAIAAADEHQRQMRKNGGTISGIATGFSSLDALCGGLQNGELYVLAARPAMGKTAFALQLARNAAMVGNTQVLFFSLEMPELQIVNRLQAAEWRIPLNHFKSGGMDDETLEAKNQTISNLINAQFTIDDSSSTTLAQLQAKARALKYQNKLGLIVIDYLQLITPADTRRHGNREQDVSAISRGLKLLAKELNVPVVVLSQLSRAVEGRPNKRPLLADLRESGAIEQDADMVAFLYRPEYYGVKNNADGLPYPARYAELIVAKHRNGQTANLPFTFNTEQQRFGEE